MIEAERHLYRSHVRMRILSDDNYIGCPDNDKIIEIWNNAKPKVENVTEAISIMLVFPCLSSIGVSVISKNTINVKATHKIKKDDKPLVYSENFTFMGNGVNINWDDLSYDYSNDCGVLFIYIKNIQLIRKPLEPLAHTRKHTSSRFIKEKLYEKSRMPSSSKPTNPTPRHRGGRRTRKRKTGRRHKKHV